MRLLRSFPATIPSHRAYVADELDRFLNAEYDYTGLGALGDDVLLIEWDVACAPEELARFAAHAALTPGEVRVAPHHLYHVAPAPVLAHRCLTTDDGQERWLRPGESECDYFAFGLIYLPQTLIQQFLAAPAPERGRSPYLPAECGYDDQRMTDQTFSIWHRHTLRRCATVDWTVRPVHLHTA